MESTPFKRSAVTISVQFAKQMYDSIEFDLAGTIHGEGGGYDPRCHEKLFAVEDRHFWFRSRNRLVAAFAARYTGRLPAGFHVLEVGC